MKRIFLKLLAPVHLILKPFLRSEYIKDVKKLLFAKSAAEAGFDKEISKDLSQAIWPSVKFGLLSLAFGIMFFIVWGSLAPLDEASIAQGSIVLSGNHKTLQHRDGGVIKSINVRDGSEVLEGQVVIDLYDTEERVNVQLLKNQLLTAMAIEARLNAEQELADNLVFDPEIFDVKGSDINKTLELQSNLFKVRRSVVSGQINLGREKISQYQDQIISSEKQIAANESQIETVESELKTQKELLQKGLATKPRLNELQKSYQELLSRQAQLKAQLGNQRQGIAEAQLEMLNTETKFQQQIADEYKENHAQLNDIKEKYSAAVDRLDRTQIKSPSRGVVADLQYFTDGGVISPGQKIMDIIPHDDELLVEAKVRPQDIDSIRIGLKAKVQLDAYKAKVVPRITGTVVYLSADVVYDEASRQPSYIARVKLAQHEIKNLKKDIKLYPGMPATVFIVKGERTFLQYLIGPIRDSFYKAFKET